MSDPINIFLYVFLLLLTLVTLYNVNKKLEIYEATLVSLVRGHDVLLKSMIDKQEDQRRPPPNPLHVPIAMDDKRAVELELTQRRKVADNQWR
jgi:hypothetical protein